MPAILLFFLSSLLIRLKRTTAHWKEGIVEELFAAGIVSLVLSLLPAVVGKPLLFCCFLALATDDLLYSRFGIRLRPELYSHFLQPTLYWSSLAGMRKEWIFPFWFLAINGIALLSAEMHASWAATGCLLLLGLIRTPKDHCFFLAVKDFRRRPQPIKREKKSYTFATEQAQFVSKEFPLLRKTESFKGEKQFDLQIGTEKPHVIFLFLESFRAKNVGCLGAKKGLTPHFDALSRKGILFSNFYANSNGTSWSTLAALFGTPPSTNRSYLHYYVDLPLIGLPQIVQSGGYHSAVIQGGSLAFQGTDAFYQTHGFQTILGKKEIEEALPQIPSTGWGVHDEGLLRFGVDWLKKQKTPTFLNLLTISNHHPWIRPAGWHPPTEALGTPYLETLAYTDWALGEMMLRLEKAGLLKNSILFIFGDHGQGMGEHDPKFAVRTTLYEEEVHVPLLIVGPGTKPQRIDAPCSQIDLLPTVLDLLGLEGPHHGLGTSLLRKKKRFVFFSYPMEEGAMGCRLGDWKALLRGSEEELYHLKSDPEELNNVKEAHPARMRRLKKMAKEYSEDLQALYEGRAFAPPSEVHGSHFAPHKEIEEEELAREIEQRRPLVSLDLSKCSRTAGMGTQESSLKRLVLSGSLRINDAGLAKIANACSQISALDLSHCPLLTDGGIAEALAKLTHLEELNLEGVQDLCRIEKSVSLRNLRHLNLLKCPQLDGASWAPWIAGLSSLKELRLCCAGWSDAELAHLAQSIRHLSAVHLSDGVSFSSPALCSFLSANRSLSGLALENCPEMGNELILALQGRPLRSLFLSGLPRITDGGLAALKGFPLEWLMIQNCPKVKEKGLIELKRDGLMILVSHCPHLKPAEVERMRARGIHVIL